MIRLIIFYTTFLVTLGLMPLASAQENDIKIITTEVTKGIYMLQGSGGNIGLSAGEDGVFMIDDQFSPLTPKILEAIGAISTKPIRFMINTHWHFDHTGGNENLGKMGVVIVAHDNVYKRLSTDQFMKAFNRSVPASPKAALPVVSFNDKVTFHLNDMHIKAHHYPHAHTDGDSVIFFHDKNVVHMGDLFFNGFYPFIDSGAGGSIYGVIDATKNILSLMDDNTKIIPGHGPLAVKSDLQAYHDMLVQVVEKVTPLAKEGLSLEEAVKADPLKELNGKWGNGFMKPDQFLGIIYQTIVDKTK